MRHAALAVAVVFALLSGTTWAGEGDPIGTIVSAAGADTTNATTAAPFVVPTGSKLTIQCSATCYIKVDSLVAASSATAVTVASGTAWATSTGNTVTIAINGVRSAVVRIAGPAAVTAIVWQRSGTE